MRHKYIKYLRFNANHNNFSIISLIIFIDIIIFLFFNSCSDSVTTANQYIHYGQAEFETEPSWSPDGNSIVYCHYDSLSGGLFVIDTNSCNKREILSGSVMNPVWSNNGDWIVCCYMGQIYKIKPNGDSLTQLTSSGSNFFPSWSPTDEWIVFDSNNESPTGLYHIWKMKSDGTQKTMIPFPQGANGGREPHYGKNGYITFESWFSNHDPGEICVMDSNGNNFKRITYNYTFDTYPRISPDGVSILYTEQQQSGMIFHISKINFDGTNYTQLNPLQAYKASWSPSGNRIVYCNSNHDNGHLWIMTSDGIVIKQLTY